jgi:uncharacterized protein (TIGR03435 family)
VFAALAATLLGAQSADSPAFDVASVRQNTSLTSSSSTRRLPNGQFLATNLTLRALIVRAYEVRNSQVVGGPDWIDSVRFDVVARAERPDADFPALLRTLLRQRFNLEVHGETREQPVYALVRARADGTLGPGIKPSVLVCSGPKAPPPQPGVPSPCGLNTSVSNRDGRMIGGAQSGADIAAAVDNYGTSRVVLDRTGLEGTYDYELRWSVDTANPARDTGGAELPALFTAIQEQLGLKVEPARGQVEIVVIDRVEQLIPD